MARPLTRAELHGLTDLRRTMKAAIPGTEVMLRTVLRGAAEVAAVRARSLAPVGTRPKPPGVPHLRDTIKAGTAGATAVDRSSASYANWIHWGGSISPKGTPIRIGPRPFVLRAIEATRPEIDVLMHRELDALYARLGL